MSATVRGLDKTKRELKLGLPDGTVANVEVDPSVKAFDTPRVGGTIHARLTRAVAISVEAP